MEDDAESPPLEQQDSGPPNMEFLALDTLCSMCEWIVKLSNPPTTTSLATIAAAPPAPTVTPAAREAFTHIASTLRSSLTQYVKLCNFP